MKYQYISFSLMLTIKYRWVYQFTMNNIYLNQLPIYRFLSKIDSKSNLQNICHVNDNDNQKNTNEKISIIIHINFYLIETCQSYDASKNNGHFMYN